MKFHRITSLWFLCFAFSIAQSPYNSISHGIILDEGDASSLAQGGSGLLPSFNSRFSIVNPSTWTDLRLTYLTAHYTTGEIEYLEQDYKAGFGRLSYSTFIIPIGDKYGWGIGLKPYSRKQFSVEDEKENIVIFSSDTLELSKTIDGMGGISSFFTGGSWKIDESKTVGFLWDFLFGAFNEVTSMNLNDDPPTIFRRRFQYKGTLLSLYLRVKPIKSFSKSTFYFSGQFPVGSRKVVITNYHSFSDQDNNGIHSSIDYPIPQDVKPEKYVHSSFFLPYTLSSGWVYHLSDQTHAGIEIVTRIISKNQDNHLSSIFGKEKSESRIGFGLLRESVASSQRFIDRFHYRIGLFQREHYISRSNRNLSEQGITLGFGIPFGLTQNQIDIGFRLSARDGFFTNETEYVRQLTLGVTIGDIWLVKRRRR